jgi:D-3-phosphoglycerate dehydrogenase
MRVLLADQFPEAQLERLEKRGHDIRFEPTLGSADLPGAIADSEALVVRSTEVTAETIESGEKLSLIVRAGAGVNTIDVAAASSRAVYVCNVPGMNSVAVAELTMGLILALDRQIPDNVSDLRNEEWRKTKFAAARGLKGRRLGIIGMGAIGTEVATRARAFGMKILAVERPGWSDDRREFLADLGVKLHPDVESMLPECDFVSLHVPLVSATEGLVNADFLARMPDGSSLINTSRASVVVADDLLEALDTKGMWAAIDVFPSEPESGEANFSSELAKHPRVYGTHHIGASTEQAQEAIAKRVVRILDAYSEGGIRNAVNLSEPMDTTTVVGIRHVDQVGVLSRVFAVLRGGNINVEHMANHVFDGARAAKAVMHIHGEFDDALRKELSELDGVFDVSVLR